MIKVNWTLRKFLGCKMPLKSLKHMIKLYGISHRINHKNIYLSQDSLEMDFETDSEDFQSHGNKFIDDASHF